MSSPDDAAQSWPISEKLHGGPLPSAHDFASAIPPILAGIQTLLDQNPDMILRGRLYGVRINFDPKAADVTSIRYRLGVACYRGGFTIKIEQDSEDARSTCEWLLRPLVHWNRTVFNDLPDVSSNGEPIIPQGDIKNYTSHHHNCLTWLGPGLLQFSGLTKAKEDQIVNFLMDEFRQHVLGVKKELNLRARAVIQEMWDRRRLLWPQSCSLQFSNPGFEDKLHACFAREGLKSEEYEDLLEQQFHNFRRGVQGKDQETDDGDFFDLEKYPVV